MGQPSRHLRALLWLIAAAPNELTDRSFYGRAALIAKLARVLAAERRRGLAGHWTYELARHRALLAAYRHEKAAFRQDFGRDAPEHMGIGGARVWKPCGPIATGPPRTASLSSPATEQHVPGRRSRGRE